MSKEKIFIFDTTLRDGAQTEGVDFSLEDKKRIAKILSEIGLDNQTNLSSLRFSFGSTNTSEEVDYLLNKLELNVIK